MTKYFYLAAAVFCIYFLQSFFLPTGGIGADSLSYFGIASDLPALKTNLFPLGFPLLLRIFYAFCSDYFWAGKMLNIFMVAGILIFSYRKNFFFRETILLFTGKTLFFALNIVSSEGPFLFLLYFLLYFLHRRFSNSIKPVNFILGGGVLLFLMVFVRYSGVYIFAGILLYVLFSYFRNGKSRLLTDLLRMLALAGLGITAYFIFNSYIYDSFTGENLRGAPAQYHAVYIFRDLLGVTNVVDPFIGLKPASNSALSLAFQVGLMVFDLLLLLWFARLYRQKRASVQANFHHLLWVVAGCYTLLLLVSGYFQQIEEMNVRMLAAANFCLFFSFLIIYFKDLQYDKNIFGLAVFFLVFLTAYSLKMPENYLKNKYQIETQMKNVSNKDFLFNDEKDQRVQVTTYRLPFSSKKFHYQHTNAQRGEIKQSIIGTVNPQIKWLKYDTVRRKSRVLYVSEFVLD